MSSTDDVKAMKAAAGVTSGEALSPPADNDGGERPVRKQLMETSIEPAPTNETGNGRKRSFEEARDDVHDPNENGDSSRKRSRESTPEDSQLSDSAAGKDMTGSAHAQNETTNPAIDGASANTSSQTGGSEDEPTKAPKKKRSREQLEENAEAGLGADAQAPPRSVAADEKPATQGEPEKKRHRDNSQERETKNAFGTSAFANTSASSPFAALGAPASSVFKPTTGLSSFGPPAGSSGFGVLGSGFSGVGSGFLGATKPGGLTSFASPNAPATLGTKAKPLGAEESEDEEESGKDEEETDTFVAEKTDGRFFERTIETGEEEEETVFACKAKLFHFSKEWKERGIGTFKVNVRTGANGKKTGRMIMRADGAGRVMLNSPIFEGMSYGNAQNEAPDSKQILLASTEGGHTIPLLLRTGNEAYAKDAYEAIRSLLAGDKDSA